MILNAGPYRRKRLPVLNSSYPQDISGTVSFPYVGTEKAFEVKIEKDGKPKTYTYQWYVNDIAVPGANSPTYTHTVKTNGTTKIYCEVSNGLGEAVKSRVASVTGKAAKQYLYNKGDQCTDVTGGWLASARMPYNGQVAPSVYFGNPMTMNIYSGPNNNSNPNNTGGCVETKNGVDLTNYSTLKFLVDYCNFQATFGSAAGGDNAMAQLGVTPNLTGTISLSKYAQIKNSASYWETDIDTIYSVDVSGFTNIQDVIVAIRTGNGNGSFAIMHVSEIWLE